MNPARNMAQGMALVGFALLLVLFWLFSSRFLSPANTRPTADLHGVIHLRASKDGHYRLTGTINGEKVRFLLDTGATQVTVSEALAARLDLPRLGLQRLDTAAGAVNGMRTVLQDLRFAGQNFHHVRALIAPLGSDEMLLGVNILRQFDWQQKDGELLLTPKSAGGD